MVKLKRESFKDELIELSDFPKVQLRDSVASDKEYFIEIRDSSGKVIGMNTVYLDDTYNIEDIKRWINNVLTTEFNK